MFYNFIISILVHKKWTTNKVIIGWTRSSVKVENFVPQVRFKVNILELQDSIKIFWTNVNSLKLNLVLELYLLLIS